MKNDDFGIGNSEVRNFAYHLTKAENEFFKDELYKPGSVLRVKRKSSKKNGEEWLVFVDGELSLSIKGSRFNNSERDYLRSPEGFSLILRAIKDGVNSVSKLKEYMKSVNDKNK
jgi:glyoxylate utilization-related uncharacterized protein